MDIKKMIMHWPSKAGKPEFFVCHCVAKSGGQIVGYARVTQKPMDKASAYPKPMRDFIRSLPERFKSGYSKCDNEGCNKTITVTGHHVKSAGNLKSYKVNF